MNRTADWPSIAAKSRNRLTAALGFLLPQTAPARETRRELSDLPDDLLRDIGLNRSDIAFVADALASGHGDPTRDEHDRLNWTAAERAAATRKLADDRDRRTVTAKPAA